MTRLFLCLTFTLGCTTQTMPDPAPADPALVRISDSSRFEELDGTQVVVHGRYVQVDVRKRIRDGGEPVYRGHTAVELTDRHRLHIEPTWSDAALRSAAEIAEFEGQLVVVTGTLHNYCPTPPEPMAAIISPCLTDVSSVEAATE